MTRTQAIDFIFQANVADLSSVMQAVQMRRNQLAMRLKCELTAGDNVKFTSARKRSPYTYTGVITDKRQSRATVRITGPSYGKYAVGTQVTVPFAMLTRA